MFGSGKVAQEIARMLNQCFCKKISTLTMCSPNSSPCVVEFLKKTPGWSLCIIPNTEVNYASLKQANLVITVTSNTADAGPLMKSKDDMRDDVVALNLACNELPMDFIHKTLKQGTMICDDVQLVHERCGQSLTNYFNRNGKTLADEALNYSIRNLAEFIPNNYPNTKPVNGHTNKKPACVTCSGMGALDVWVALKLLKAIAEMKGGII
eukprot:gb/GEZJ01005645.1/.p1 GENE.gb/GEZJ01005645.1/~~gb/GEZJ01005645.1/.p1  ORF type:complete len:209 (-),score=15.63 gb/GEZJ01005645.1/:48-674(-)